MLNLTKNSWITFQPTSGSFDAVTCMIGDGEQGVSVDSSSYGGIEIIERPRNVGVLNWTGRNPLQLNIPIMFDNLQTGGSVEADILNLEQLAGRGLGVGGSTPPAEITLVTQAGFGALIPHYKSGDLTYLISNIDWGDAVRRSAQNGAGGHRIRQAGVVTVLQNVQSQSLKTLSVSKRNKAHSARNRTHVVKKGETLQSISRLEYGTANKWTDIRAANGIHDPNHLPVGKKLKIP